MAFNRRQIILGAVCLGLGGLGVAAVAAPNGGAALVAMLCLSTLLLLALLLVLADLDVRVRSLTFVSIGLPITLVLPGLAGGRGEVFGAVVGVLAIIVGVFLPVRLYVGSLGPPRVDAPPRRASLQSLFLLTTYYAVLAACLARNEAGFPLAIFGLVLSILALGPPLLLARPLGLRIVGGLLTACLALLACFMVAAAMRHGFSHVSLQLIPLLSPAAACAVLWAYGLQLRR